jgi:hypothetical protein
MFWLITMLATLGVGGASLFATLNRMGANIEKLFKDAPALTEDTFAEGKVGRITGVVAARGKPLTAPGAGVPCVVYELVVYASSGDRATSDWRVVHREIAGGELEIAVGNSVVRLDAQNLYIVKAPAHDATTDLRSPGGRGAYTSRVRFVPVGATVQVVGTLTREVNMDPSAQNNYREIATHYRLVGSRRLPIVLAA